MSLILDLLKNAGIEIPEDKMEALKAIDQKIVPLNKYLDLKTKSSAKDDEITKLKTTNDEINDLLAKMNIDTNDKDTSIGDKLMKYVDGRISSHKLELQTEKLVSNRKASLLLQLKDEGALTPELLVANVDFEAEDFNVETITSTLKTKYENQFFKKQRQTDQNPNNPYIPNNNLTMNELTEMYKKAKSPQERIAIKNQIDTLRLK